MAIIIHMESADKHNNFAAARAAMVRLHLLGRDITDPAVLEAFSQIPREQFVPRQYITQAYDDAPVPIGMGQTISQPYIVALMTQKLRLNGQCEVLEIGTGSGYQTAILAKLSCRVYTIERIAELSRSAQAILGKLGIDNVEYYIGDGTKGWPEKKEFDRIIITAAAIKMPEPLLEQLKAGGLAVAPLGADYVQELVVMEKTADGIQQQNICGCRFVRLIGEHGYENRR